MEANVTENGGGGGVRGERVNGQEPESSYEAKSEVPKSKQFVDKLLIDK